MGEMNMGKLTAILNKKGFPKVDRTFYRDVREYMEGLKAELEEAVSDGDDIAAAKIEKTIAKAERYYMRIYNRRIEGLLSKIIKKMSSGAHISLSEFTPEEIEIFNSISEMLEFKREALLHGDVDLLDEGTPDEIIEIEEDVESDAVEDKPMESPEHEAETDSPAVQEHSVTEGSKKEAPSGEKEDEVPARKKEAMVTIRMLDDATFMGLDGVHNYHLKKGDIVNIEKLLAKIIVESGKGEAVEIRW